MNALTIEKIEKYVSPQSAIGWAALSVALHLLAIISVVGLLHLNVFSSPAKTEEYIDLAYQTFDAPPAPAQEEQRVRRSAEPKTQVDAKLKPDNTPKEIQDEKSDIAGTEKAQKESNIGSENIGDASATPYYKIKPTYPRAALAAGIEGWVLLTIDVNEHGGVENIRVVDGAEQSVFQNEARRAVALYKYRPFVDKSGKIYRKIDHQVRINFKIEDEVASGG